MGDALKFLEGLTFYGTLAALAVMAGMWYFWFHILPKIKAYDQSRKILEIIVPKIGDDLNIIEQGVNEARETLTKSLIAIAEELREHREILEHNASQHPDYHNRLDEIMRVQKSQGRRILNYIARLEGKDTYDYDSEVYNRENLDEEESYNPVGGDTEMILDELSIEDIRGIIRNDRTLFPHQGEERRSYLDRRDGIERRRTEVIKKGDDRRLFKRRSGKDRREEKTIGHLKKLSQIVDALQGDPETNVDRLRRRSRISDF